METIGRINWREWVEIKEIASNLKLYHGDFNYRTKKDIIQDWAPWWELSIRLKGQNYFTIQNQVDHEI